MTINKITDDSTLVVQLTVSQVKTMIRDLLLEVVLSPKVETEILAIEEVAELTGYKKSTLYKLTHERKIPFHKPAHGGRRIFFKREEINQWMQSNRIENYKEYSKNAREKMEVKTSKK